jgi:hypothetical protein
LRSNALNYRSNATHAFGELSPDRSRDLEYSA